METERAAPAGGEQGGAGQWTVTDHHAVVLPIPPHECEYCVDGSTEPPPRLSDGFHRYEFCTPEEPHPLCRYCKSRRERNIVDCPYCRSHVAHADMAEHREGCAASWRAEAKRLAAALHAARERADHAEAMMQAAWAIVRSYASD